MSRRISPFVLSCLPPPSPRHDKSHDPALLRVSLGASCASSVSPIPPRKTRFSYRTSFRTTTLVSLRSSVDFVVYRSPPRCPSGTCVLDSSVILVRYLVDPTRRGVLWGWVGSLGKEGWRYETREEGTIDLTSRGLFSGTPPTYRSSITSFGTYGRQRVIL